MYWDILRFYSYLLYICTNTYGMLVTIWFLGMSFRKGVSHLLYVFLESFGSRLSEKAKNGKKKDDKKASFRLS